MSGTVIKIENLGKQYRVGEISTGTLSKDFQRWCSRILGKDDPYSKIGQDRAQSRIKDQNNQFIWALKDIHFEVKQGEVLGIVGKNGAGKSTLLKILSQVTSPTTGEVRIKGRIASLLEIGTGFHSELTGRENIYLNGAILGMTKREIRIKFDQIVDFSGIEQYIDTPVKRYSSGMYVRLAFSVAAHLEPEILIVDEVLAVGDSEFQKKCLGKMQDVSQKEGRTVLFVSHNLSTVENLCKNSILLEKGRLKEFDATSRIIIDYLNNKNEIELNLNDRNDRKGNGLIKFTKINISDSLRKTDKRVFIGSPMEINIELSKHVDIKLLNFKVAIGIDNESGTRITIIDSEVSGINYFEITEKSILIKIVIERLTLFPGKYYYTLFTSLNSDICDWIVNAGSFNVDPGDFYGTGKLPPSNQAKILLDYRFKSND